MNRIIKITEEELKQINKYTVKDLKAEDVYAFTVVLCDNDVDRDDEYFTTKSLDDISKICLGRNGIFDGCEIHAKIYDAEVVEDVNKKTKYNETYNYVLAKAFVLTTNVIINNFDKFKLLFESGIYDEVSISCSVSTRWDSPYGDYKELVGVTDFYEWSFVSTPHLYDTKGVKTIAYTIKCDK